MLVDPAECDEFLTKLIFSGLIQIYDGVIKVTVKKAQKIETVSYYVLINGQPGQETFASANFDYVTSKFKVNLRLCQIKSEVVNILKNIFQHNASIEILADEAYPPFVNRSEVEADLLSFFQKYLEEYQNLNKNNKKDVGNYYTKVFADVAKKFAYLYEPDRLNLANIVINLFTRGSLNDSIWLIVNGEHMYFQLIDGKLSTNPLDPAQFDFEN